MKNNYIIGTNCSVGSNIIFDNFHRIANEFYKEIKKNDENANVIYLTKYGSVKNAEALFERNNKCKFYDEIIVVNECFHNIDYNEETWEHIMNKVDISKIPKICKIIEIGSALSDSADLRDNSINYEQMFKNNKSYKFISIRNPKNYITLTFAILNRDNAEFDHYVLDPLELNYNDLSVKQKYTRFFGYTIPSYKLQRNDKILDSHTFETLEKKYDFTFGYTVLTNERKTRKTQFLLDQIENSDLKYNILVRNKYLDINTMLPKQEYLNTLKETKFTLIIPAYNKETFSIFRFQESIMCGCIPLILDTSYLYEVKKDFYIPDEIIVNETNIIEKIKTLDYDKLINLLKTETLKK